MPDPIPSPMDFLRAHDVCAYLSANLEIGFQMNVNEMTRPDAVKHFEQRKALLIVRNMLVEAGERTLKPS